MRLNHPRQPLKDEENLIPLINVVFLLLIFFLVAGSMAPAIERDIEPAQQKNAEAAQLSSDAVFINREGMLLSGGQALTPEMLAQVRGVEANNPLEIFVDHRLPAQDLIALSAQLREAGFQDLRLITKRRGA